MELKPPDGCAMDGHDYICLTCSGKKREDLMDRAEVVEVFATWILHLPVGATWPPLTSLVDLGIWPAVEKRAKELEEER